MDLFLTLIYEMFWITFYVIFFAYINIGPPKKTGLIIYILNILISSVVYMLCGKFIANIYNFSTIVLYCTFVSKDKKISVRLFWGVICCINMIVSDFIASIIFMKMGLFDFINFEKMNQTYSILIMSIMGTIMIIFSIIISFTHSKKRLTRINAAVLLIPVKQLLLIFIFTSIIFKYHIELNDIMLVLSFIITVVLGMIINIIILKLSDHMTEKKLNKQKKMFFDYYNKVAEEYFKKNEQNLLEIRKIKHDFNNSIYVIKSLIDKKDFKNAQELLQQLENEHNQYSVNKYTENNIMDILLTHTESLYKEQNIHFCCNCRISENLNINQLDICNISNNILKNALENVSNINNEKRISFSAIQNKDMIFIKCTNTKSNIIKNVNTKFLTNKADNINHGFGMDIIQHIADLYAGNVITEYDDKEFTIIVQLNNTINVSTK